MVNNSTKGAFTWPLKSASFVGSSLEYQCEILLLLLGFLVFLHFLEV